MAKKATKKTRRKPRKTITSVHVPDSCPKCGSTERTAYEDILTRPIAGETRVAGEPVRHTSISWKRTTCKNCGQARRVRVFNFDPSAQK